MTKYPSTCFEDSHRFSYNIFLQFLINRLLTIIRRNLRVSNSPRIWDNGGYFESGLKIQWNSQQKKVEVIGIFSRVDIFLNTYPQ